MIFGLSSTKPDTDENVVKGEILSREYRGSVTDHKIQVGRVSDNRDVPIGSATPQNCPPHLAQYIYEFPLSAIRPLATSD